MGEELTERKVWNLSFYRRKVSNNLCRKFIFCYLNNFATLCFSSTNKSRGFPFYSIFYSNSNLGDRQKQTKRTKMKIKHFYLVLFFFAFFIGSMKGCGWQKKNVSNKIGISNSIRLSITHALKHSSLWRNYGIFLQHCRISVFGQTSGVLSIFVQW